MAYSHRHIKLTRALVTSMKTDPQYNVSWWIRTLELPPFPSFVFYIIFEKTCIRGLPVAIAGKPEDLKYNVMKISVVKQNTDILLVVPEI